MTKQALFSGLVYDEQEQLVQTVIVGEELFYVVDDNGFRRHIVAEDVDRQVLQIFLDQLEGNRDLAVEQMLNMMGQDDLFAKAVIDASLRQINLEQIMAQGIPAQARDMLGMLGLRIVINYHGELVRLDQPTMPDDGGEA